MAKITTTIEKMNSKILSDPKRVEKLKNDIKEEIVINDKLDADQVRQLIIGWKKVEDTILTPLTTAKKESYDLYKIDQTAEKTAKTTLSEIKQELVDKFNAFALPIAQQEEDANTTNKKTEHSINTTGLRKQPDKYIVHVEDINKIPTEYLTITPNESKIIEYFKKNKEELEGIKIEVIKGQYK